MMKRPEEGGGSKCAAFGTSCVFIGAGCVRTCVCVCVVCMSVMREYRCHWIFQYTPELTVFCVGSQVHSETGCTECNHSIE